MEGNYNLKVDKATCEKIIKHHIEILKDLQDINEIKNAFKQINLSIREVLDSNEVFGRDRNGNK